MIYNFKVLLLLLSSTLTIRAISDADLCKLEPEFDIIQRHSADKERLLVVKRHPTDCSKFYICQTEDYPLILSCPAGLYYDENYGWCDYPENVDCPIQQPESSSTDAKSTESTSTDALTSTELSTTTTEPPLIYTTSEPFDPKAIRLHLEEIEAKYFHLRYSCTHDRYDRLLLQSDGSEVTLESNEGWESLTYGWKFVRREIEFNYRTVYLAQQYSHAPGTITWKFDFPLVIKTIDLKFETTIFGNAVIRLSFLDKNEVQFDDIQALVGQRQFTIFAELNSGWWQNAQLFRQILESEDFPFELKISFE